MGKCLWISPMFLLEVMDCSTGIWGPRGLLQAAASKIAPPSSLHARHPELNVDAISDQSSVQANGPAARDAPLPPQQRDLCLYSVVFFFQVGLWGCRNPTASFRMVPPSSAPFLFYFVTPTVPAVFNCKYLSPTWRAVSTDSWCLTQWFPYRETLVPAEMEPEPTDRLSNGSHGDLQHMIPRIPLLSSFLGCIPNPGSSLCYSMDNQQSLH